MRVKFAGRRSVAELRALLMQACDSLERSGVAHVTGANLYLTTLNEDGAELEMVGADGQPVDLVFTTPKVRKPVGPQLVADEPAPPPRRGRKASGGKLRG